MGGEKKQDQEQEQWSLRSSLTELYVHYDNNRQGVNLLLSLSHLKAKHYVSFNVLVCVCAILLSTYCYHMNDVDFGGLLLYVCMGTSDSESSDN